MPNRDVNININGKDNFTGAANSAGRSANALKSTLDKLNGPIGGGLGGGLTSLIGGVGLGAATASFVSFGVKSAAAFEQTSVAFKTMLKSGAGAKDLLAEISKFASETPFEFPELADAGKKLLAFGVAGNEIVPTLRRIGDVSSAIGAPIGEIAELYGKARVQGRLFAQDINQLTGRGIPIIQEIAKQFHTTEDNVRKLVETGQVGFANLEQAFKDMTSSGGQFFGMMAEQSQTLSGKFSTLKDNIGALAREWADKLIPVMKLHADVANFALTGDIAGIPKMAKAINMPTNPNVGTWLNQGDAIDAGMNALKTEQDPERRAKIQAQIDAMKARRAATKEQIGRDNEQSDAFRARLAGGLSGALGTTGGLSGLLGGAFDSIRDGTRGGMGALGDAVEKEKFRRKVFEQTRTPREKLDADIRELDAHHEALGDELYNRRRAQLQAEFEKTQPHDKENKFHQERLALAPLTEARFLTAAPGYASDPAAMAKQQADDTKESKEVQKQQLVVLRAMERKLDRQARLGVL